MNLLWPDFLSVKRLIFILRKFQTSRQLKTCSSSAPILKMANNFFIGRNWPWSNKNLGQGTILDHQQSEKIKYPGHDKSLEPAFLHNDQSAFFSMVKENSYSSFSKEINHQVRVPQTVRIGPGPELQGIKTVCATLNRAKINRKNGINLIVTGKYKDLPLWLFLRINEFKDNLFIFDC